MSLVKEITVKIKCEANGYLIRWYNEGWHHWYFHSGGENFNTTGELYRTSGYSTLSIGDNVTKEQLTTIRGILNAKFIELYTDDGWKPATIGDETFAVGRADRTGSAVSFNISAWLKGSGLTPIEDVEETSMILWVNNSGNYIINSNGNRIVFKKIA